MENIINSKIEEGAILGDNVLIIGSSIDAKSVIGNGAVIENSTIRNSKIECDVKILNSCIFDSLIKKDACIGPYTHIRGSSVIGEKCKIGNFVEVKGSVIGRRSKACHLSYIGDTEIGEDCNIGCGVVFANYNGINKFKTCVGDRVFIGCNSTIIAPCTLKDESFIAAGSTIVSEVQSRHLAIARAKQVNKDNFFNPYLQNFKRQKLYFGTDGIRGIYGKDLTEKLAFTVGNALCQMKASPRIIIGMDTRRSGKKLLNAFCKGATCGGAEVFTVGIVPSSCVSFLTRKFKADFGVMITASHNPKEYNGLKVFDCSGVKLSDEYEAKLESKFKTLVKTENGVKFDLSAEVDSYIKFLTNSSMSLNGLKIMLDTANGASSKIAPDVFKKLGADVKVIKNSKDINDGCGCTNIDFLKENMLNGDSDIGFAYDGDADRLLCVNKNGEIIDGDKIIYLLALWYKKIGKKVDEVVGTIMTNSYIEELLKEKGISLIRTDVGDKYVIEYLMQSGLNIGGEQAGHIIIADKHYTGDGILTSVFLASIYAADKQFFEENSRFCVYPTYNSEIKTLDRPELVFKKPGIRETIERYENEIRGNGRIIVRPSGTEPKIRLTIEGKGDFSDMLKRLKEDIQKLL